MGQDAGQLCEVARSKYRRFMLPSKDSRPEAGRCDVRCFFRDQKLTNLVDVFVGVL